MRRRILSLLAISLTLMGCQNAGNGSGDFPFVDDPDKAYLTRNGDNYGKGGLSHSYQSMCRTFSATRIQEALDDGKQVVLFFEMDGCKSCESAHNDLTHFYLSSLVEVESVHFEDGNHEEIRDELRALRDAHPSISEALGDTIYFPSMFLIKNEKKTLPLSFLSQRESLQNLYDFFKGLMNFTLVYNFQTYDAFARFYKENDCLVYMDEEGAVAPTPFYQNVYPLASHSQKITAHIETKYVSPDDKAKFDSLLPEKTYKVEKGELAPVSSDQIPAYYA